jgi:hypothetical protein
MALISNSGRSNRFFISPKRLNWLLDTLNFSLRQCQGPFPGLQQPRSEADSLLSFCADIKNEWSYTSSPLCSLTAWPGTYASEQA